MTAKKFLYYSVFEFAACFTCREVFFVDEPVLTVPKLYVSLPTCLLRVVDNDSGEELTRVFQKVAPNNLKKNKVSLYCLLCFKLLETKIENIHSANAANERSQENIKKARFGSLLSNWRCKTITLFTRAKGIRTARQIFGTVPRLPVPRLPAPKFWALMPHYIWDRYVYTSKTGSAVP